MFKLKLKDGRHNIAGRNIKRIRMNRVPKMSQRKHAKKMQLAGYDIDHPVIRRIESGQRFITDIELIAFAKVLNVPVQDLLKMETNF